ncbi:MAG TPA: PQQ-binding-like beta-propeller repeat protein, partial [Thermoplasmata archaeon]|nr:PQQ-binding-like beta-propeller repeat protein [Thermoplasmata archaeon]
MAAPVPRRLLGFLLFLAIALLAAAPLGARAEWSQYGATVTHSFDGGATPPAALGLIWSQVTNVAANATTAITGTLAVGGGTIQYAFHADLDGRNPANLWLRKMAIDNGSMAANVRGWEFRETAANLSSLGSAGLVGPPRTLALSGTRLYGLVTAQNGTDAQDVLFSLDVSSGNSTQVALTLLVFRTAPWPAVSQTASRSAPAIGEGFLVFGSNDGAVYALWESNFTLAWRYATGTPIVTVPSVYGNFVYVTAGSRLNFLDLIGRLIFSVPAPAAITASPVVS